MTDHKWHYYDSQDDLCNYTSPCGKFHWKSAYCGRSIMYMHRHTEFKSRVTCLSCLRKINEIDNNKILED